MFRRTLPCLLLPRAALAHSELRGAIPADGARIAAPAELRLRFNEAAQVTLWQLRDAAGVELSLAWPRDAAARVEHIARPPVLAAGEYHVAWRAISADGHPIRGGLRFTVTP